MSFVEQVGDLAQCAEFDAGILKDEIHVWICPLTGDEDAQQLSRLSLDLSVDELKRYQGFGSARDGQIYLRSRAMLRRLLSKYSDVEPSQWQFVLGEHGRPGIDASQHGQKLDFNLSHTSDICACVISDGRACGIDVENTGRQSDYLKVAKRMFAEAELEAISSPVDEKAGKKAFFQYWTLREAYLKALGVGLAGSSKDFQFSIDGAEISLRTEAGVGEDGSYWQFALFDPTGEHTAAVAVQNPDAADRRIIYRMIEF